MFDSQLFQENKIRQVDGYLPRAQIKRQFSETRVQLNDPDTMKKFSNEYIVEENYVKKTFVLTKKKCPFDKTKEKLFKQPVGQSIE